MGVPRLGALRNLLRPSQGKLDLATDRVGGVLAKLPPCWLERMSGVAARWLCEVWSGYNEHGHQWSTLCGGIWELKTELRADRTPSHSLPVQGRARSTPLGRVLAPAEDGAVGQERGVGASDRTVHIRKPG